jgi:Flp pilus assembly protein TadG
MIGFVKRLRKDRRGNVLVILGAGLPLLVGAAGLATDTIQWTLWKRQLQRAADSGAIAGVYTRISNNTQTAVDDAVDADLELNNHVGIPLSAGFPDVDLLADSGDQRTRVRVTLELSKSLPFSSMFMTSAPTISATATAATVPGADEFCILATDTSASKTGIEITGSTYLDLGKCSLMANSKHATAAASNGNSGGGNSGSGSIVKAKSLAAAGAVKYSNNWTVSDYDPNSPTIVDPFDTNGQQPLPNPKSSDCSPGKTVATDMTKNQSYPMDRTTGTNKDTAGQTVCFSGGVKVQGTLKLQTGVTYIINGGDLNMSSSSASLSCTGCTIILTNFANPANTGNIKLTGGTLSLTAPTSGTYKGVALYQDRRATDDGTMSQNQINGNNGASLTGAVYLGNRSLLYNGGSGTVAACVQIVSKRVSFSGNSNIAMASQCPLSGITAIGGGTRVRLVA